MRYDVYVPAAGAQTLIDQGSGIVGTTQDDGRVLADYEGNRFGSSNIKTYADRVAQAAGRHATRYPTIARSLLPTGALIRIGSYDDHTGVVTLDDDSSRDQLLTWLRDQTDPRAVHDSSDATGQRSRSSEGASDLDEELRTAGSARHQMMREVEAARASGDPARVLAADHMVRRYRLDD